MTVQKLKDFLDKNNVKYVTINHSVAYTAQQVAESAHVSAKILAKVVMIKLDDKLCMVIVPAHVHVKLETLKSETNAKTVELATESEFKSKFPDCELGAMPPFGNLYDMDVYASEALSKQKQIAFNAGSHSELIQLDYDDFENFVKPKMISASR